MNIENQIANKLLVNPNTLSKVRESYPELKDIDMDKAYEKFLQYYIKTTEGPVDSHKLFSEDLNIPRHVAKVLAISIATDSILIRRIMMDHEDTSDEKKLENLAALYDAS